MLRCVCLKEEVHRQCTPVYCINVRVTAFTSSLWIHDVKEQPDSKLPPWGEGCVISISPKPVNNILKKIIGGVFLAYFCLFPEPLGVVGAGVSL